VTDDKPTIINVGTIGHISHGVHLGILRSAAAAAMVSLIEREDLVKRNEEMVLEVRDYTSDADGLILDVFDHADLNKPDGIKKRRHKQKGRNRREW